MTFEFSMTVPGPLYHATKRILDVTIALLTLLVATPLLLLIICAVRATGAPAFFRQVRIGLDGRPFTILKFRTMKREADPYASKPQCDARQVTRLGRILRRTGLDELPQLANVLRGEMSLVGPRPEMPFIAECYTSVQRLRLQARPGLTGLWQISERRLEPIHEHMEYDLFYLAHRRILFELWILLRTALMLLGRSQIRLDSAFVGRWGGALRRLEPQQRIVLDLPAQVVQLVSSDAVS